MSKICLIVLIGLPGTGKTTFANKLLQELISFKVIHVCYDNFIHIEKEFKQDIEIGYYKNERQKLLQLIEHLMRDIQEENKCFQSSIKYSEEILLNQNFKLPSQVCEEDNFVILVDDNNYYRSMRYEFLKLTKKHRTGFFQLYFKSSLEKSITRNENRSFNKIPNHIIHTMYSRIEEPQIINNWERNYLVINIEEPFSFLKRNLTRMINERLENPEKVLALSRPIEHSIFHTIDIILRKYIGVKIQEEQIKNTHLDIKNYAFELNVKRKRVLDDLKKNIVNIPVNLDEIKSYIK